MVDGYGQVVRVHYEPMTNSSVYARSDSIHAAPEVELIASTIDVVSHLYRDNGILPDDCATPADCPERSQACTDSGASLCSSFVTYAYRYSSHLYHTQGWGDLGCGLVSSEQRSEPGGPTRTLTQRYSQHWVNMSQGLLISSLDAITVADAMHTLSAHRLQHNASVWLQNALGQPQRRVVITMVHETTDTNDLSGLSLGSSTRELEYDDLGNVINETQVQRDEFGEYGSNSLRQWSHEQAQDEHYLIHLVTLQRDTVQTVGQPALSHTSSTEYLPVSGVIARQTDWLGSPQQLQHDYECNEFGSQVSIAVSAPFQPAEPVRVSRPAVRRAGPLRAASLE